MKAWGTAVTITLWLAAAPAWAVDAGADGGEPPPQDVQLLDEVPNYAEILAHQWSDGVPQDVIDAEKSTGSYGRLLDAPFQATSLAECVALALKNNTSLQIQRLSPQAAGAGVLKARSVFDPDFFATVLRDRTTTPSTTILTSGGAPAVFRQDFTLNAGIRKTLLTGGRLSLEFDNNRLNSTASIANVLVPQYTTTLGLSLNQPLLRNFGWRYSLLLIDVAERTEEATYQQYAAAIATIVAQVERAYWFLVLATESVRVQEQGLALANELLRQNQGKFNVGALPHTAVLEAQVDAATREAQLIQVSNARDNARDTLRALINARNPDAAALLMIDPQDKPTVVAYDVDLERSLHSALAQRPELIAARLDIDAKGLQRKVAENGLLPQLNFVGGIGLNGLSGGRPVVFFGNQTDPVSGQPVTDKNGQVLPGTLQAAPFLDGGYSRSLDLLTDGRYYNYSAGVAIDIPLDNAQAKADYATANIALSQSRLSLQQLQEQVTLEIKTAVSNLRSDLKSIEATHVARELAEENVRNQKARYDVGLATTKDLLDYADRLTRAQFAEIQALTAYNSDLAEMRRVDGTLLSARNVVLERTTSRATPWWARF